MKYLKEDLKLQPNGAYLLPCCGTMFSENTKFPVRCGCHPDKLKRDKVKREAIMNHSESAKKLDEVVEHLENQEGVTLENYQHKDPEGLGDTLENVFKSFGITEDTIKGWTGLKGCGCEKRKKFLNKVFPYRKKKADQ
jgi:hypothetical protein